MEQDSAVTVLAYAPYQCRQQRRNFTLLIQHQERYKIVNNSIQAMAGNEISSPTMKQKLHQMKNISKETQPALDLDKP